LLIKLENDGRMIGIDLAALIDTAAQATGGLNQQIAKTQRGGSTIETAEFTAESRRQPKSSAIMRFSFMH